MASYRPAAKGNSSEKVKTSKNKKGKIVAQKAGYKSVAAGDTKELAKEAVKAWAKVFDKVENYIPDGTFIFTQKQFMDEIAKALKQVERSNLLNSVSNKTSLLSEARSGVYAALETLWGDYVSEYKKAFDDMYNGYVKIFADSGLPQEIIDRNLKYAKDTFKREVDPSRRQEFYAYVMSGQLKKFRPVDFIPHWVQGDIVIKDSEGADSHIQLKQTGGHFKIGFNTEYFEKAIKPLQQAASLKQTNGVLDYTQARAFDLAQKLISDFHSEYVKKGRPVKNISKANKIKIMEGYAGTTKSDYVIIEYKGASLSGSGYGFSITIRKDQLVDFVAKYHELFDVTIGNKNQKNGFPGSFQLTIKNPSKRMLMYMRLSVGGLFMHGYDEIEYYKKVGSRASKGVEKKKIATDYVENVLTPRWSEFYTIHRQLYGPIKYKIQE
jgi:hypothetical protein